MELAPAQEEAHMDDPGRVPDADEVGLRAAGQAVVTELYARLDRRDFEGAVELYAENAVLEGAKGKSEIRETILRSVTSNAGQPTSHTVTNVRAAVTGPSEVVVHYTVVAYRLDGPGPYAAHAILDQHQVLRVAADGNLRIHEHRVEGYDLSGSP
jgi:hypothetical protein